MPYLPYFFVFRLCLHLFTLFDRRIFLWYNEAKTYKGKPLKKKRYLGKIPQGKYSFFESSVMAAQSSAISVFNEQLNKYIENAWNNGQHNTSR